MTCDPNKGQIFGAAGQCYLSPVSCEGRGDSDCLGWGPGNLAARYACGSAIARKESSAMAVSNFNDALVQL
jgi:hypothetical protein